MLQRSMEFNKTLTQQSLQDNEFTYGMRTWTYGTDECCVYLKLIEERGKWWYLGNLRFPGSKVIGLRGTVFHMLARDPNRDDVWDVAAYGRLGSGGAFMFPFLRELDGRTCRIEIAPALNRRPADLPQLALTRNVRPRLLIAGSKPPARHFDLIKVDAEYITIRVPNQLAPYDLVCAASTDIENNQILAIKLLHASSTAESDLKGCRCERGILFRGRADDKVMIDAWPLTTAPDTRRLITDTMLDTLAAENDTAARKIREFRTDVSRLESESQE